MSSDPIQQGVGESGAAARDVRAGETGAGASILSTISELEARFSGLKKLHEQTVEREAQLVERQKLLDDLEATLRDRSQSLERRQSDVERAAASIREQEQAAGTLRAELEQMRAQIEESGRMAQEQHQRAEEWSRKLAAAQNELESRDARLTSERAKCDEAIASIDQREKVLAEREHVLGEQDRRVVERERKVGEEEKRSAAAEFKIAEQRQVLSRDLEEFAERDRSLSAREQQSSVREQEVEQLKKRFAEQAVRVAEREERIDKVEQALTERESGLKSLTLKIGEQEQQLVARVQQAAAREKAAAEAEQRLAERERAIKDIEHQLAERGAGLAEQERLSGEKRRRVEDAEKAVQAAQRDLEAQSSALEDLDRGVRERESQIEAARAELGKTEQELARKQTLLAEEHLKARQELGKVRGELDERESRLRETEAAMKQRVDEIRRHAEKVERERVAVAEQAKTLAAQLHGHDHGAAIYAGRQEQLQIQLGEANAKRASAETELSQARQEISRLAEEVRQATAAADAAREGNRADSIEQERRLTELEQQFADSQDSLRTLNEKLAAAESAAASSVGPEQLAERDAAIEELKNQLEETTRVNNALKQRLDDGSQNGGAMDGAATEEIAKRDQAIQLLKERLDEVEAHCQSLEAELESSRADGDPDQDLPARMVGDPGALEARRERLRKYKSLLQVQARKIVQAQSALQKRHSDCEQVLAQRMKLSQVAADLSRREKKMESSKARSGASAAVLYVVATLGILGVLSWQLARQIWPGTYIATAILEADSHGRSPNDTELSTWETYHTDLLSNPSLIEVAAHRMGQRGLAQYANPADLKAKLTTDLYHQSSEPGSITIELKNEGAERARLVLDTLVTAIKSVSDASRDQRPDDLGLTIAQAATAGAEPFVNQQFERAGALLGGGALAVGLFGLVIWNRLARAKHKFEHAQAVEAALNEVDWATMEQTLKRPPPGAASPGDRAEGERKPRRKE